MTEGVRELRVKDRDNQFRTIYVIPKGDDIIVLHTFIKKSRTTAKADINIAKERLKDFKRNQETAFAMMKSKTTKGNVFKDLGFTDGEAIALAMRVDLAVEIEKFIRQKNLTQTRASKYFGIPQPKISKILRGKIDEFSIDYLVKVVAKTGKTPRVSFTRKKAA